MSNTESLSVIKDTSDPYTGVHCVFEAFPPSRVSWTRGDDMESAVPFDSEGIRLYNVIERDTGSNFTGVDNGIVRFSYTVCGGIVFDQLEYDDAGIYYCSADNGYSTLDRHIRLRVRG